MLLLCPIQLIPIPKHKNWVTSVTNLGIWLLPKKIFICGGFKLAEKFLSFVANFDLNTLRSILHILRRQYSGFCKYAKYGSSRHWIQLFDLSFFIRKMTTKVQQQVHLSLLRETSYWWYSCVKIAWSWKTVQVGTTWQVEMQINFRLMWSLMMTSSMWNHVTLT